MGRATWNSPYKINKFMWVNLFGIHGLYIRDKLFVTLSFMIVGVKLNMIQIIQGCFVMECKESAIGKHHMKCWNSWYNTLIWLVLSTHLKHIIQIGNLPQIGVKTKYLKPPPSNLYKDTFAYCSPRRMDCSLWVSQGNQLLEKNAPKILSFPTNLCWRQKYTEFRNLHCLKLTVRP